MADPYEVLGVARDASAQDIKAAFRREASAAHPDKGGDTARMAAVNDAYALLSDPERRQRFDETGATTDAPSIEDEAAQLLAQIFSQAIQQEAAQLTDFARSALAGALQDLGGRTADAKRKVAKLQTRRDKVRTKDGAQNLVHGLIDGQIAGLNAGVAKMEHGTRVVTIAQTLLAAYDEDRPPVPEAGLSGFFQQQAFSSTATGAWR